MPRKSPPSALTRKRRRALSDTSSSSGGGGGGGRDAISIHSDDDDDDDDDGGGWLDRKPKASSDVVRPRTGRSPPLRPTPDGPQTSRTHPRGDDAAGRHRRRRGTPQRKGQGIFRRLTTAAAAAFNGSDDDDDSSMGDLPPPPPCRASRGKPARRRASSTSVTTTRRADPPCSVNPAGSNEGGGSSCDSDDTAELVRRLTGKTVSTLPSEDSSPSPSPSAPNRPRTDRSDTGNLKAQPTTGQESAKDTRSADPSVDHVGLLSNKKPNHRPQDGDDDDDSSIDTVELTRQLLPLKYGFRGRHRSPRDNGKHQTGPPTIRKPQHAVQQSKQQQPRTSSGILGVGAPPADSPALCQLPTQSDSSASKGGAASDGEHEIMATNVVPQRRVGGGNNRRGATCDPRKDDVPPPPSTSKAGEGDPTAAGPKLAQGRTGRLIGKPDEANLRGGAPFPRDFDESGAVSRPAVGSNPLPFVGPSHAGYPLPAGVPPADARTASGMDAAQISRNPYDTKEGTKYAEEHRPPHRSNPYSVRQQQQQQHQPPPRPHEANNELPHDSFHDDRHIHERTRVTPARDASAWAYGATEPECRRQQQEEVERPVHRPHAPQRHVRTDEELFDEAFYGGVDVRRPMEGDADPSQAAASVGYTATASEGQLFEAAFSDTDNNHRDNNNNNNNGYPFPSTTSQSQMAGSVYGTGGGEYGTISHRYHSRNYPHGGPHRGQSLMTSPKFNVSARCFLNRQFAHAPGGDENLSGETAGDDIGEFHSEEAGRHGLYHPRRVTEDHSRFLNPVGIGAPRADAHMPDLSTRHDQQRQPQSSGHQTDAPHPQRARPPLVATLPRPWQTTTAAPPRPRRRLRDATASNFALAASVVPKRAARGEAHPIMSHPGGAAAAAAAVERHFPTRGIVNDAMTKMKERIRATRHDLHGHVDAAAVDRPLAGRAKAAPRDRNRKGGLFDGSVQGADDEVEIVEGPSAAWGSSNWGAPRAANQEEGDFEEVVVDDDVEIVAEPFAAARRTSPRAKPQARAGWNHGGSVTKRTGGRKRRGGGGARDAASGAGRGRKKASSFGGRRGRGGGGDSSGGAWGEAGSQWSTGPRQHREDPAFQNVGAEISF